MNQVKKEKISSEKSSIIKVIFVIFLSCLTLLSTGCETKKTPYPYDESGFENYNKSGSTKITQPAAPQVQTPPQQYNPSQVRTAPDYYYRQPYTQQQTQPYPQSQQPYPSAYPPQQYPQPYPSAYQQPPQYQQPAPYQQPYVNPGSRFYTNPYAIPPSNYYPYQDSDQYYIPPTSYNNTEPQPRPISLGD